MDVPTWGQMGSADAPGKMDKKIKKRKHAKKSSFLCVWYILRAIRAGRCRERRYADHIFIQIYFRMHYFVVKFSKCSSPQAARGHWPPNQNPADVPGRDCNEHDTIRYMPLTVILTIIWYSITHSFIPGLKPPFLQILPTTALPFSSSPFTAWIPQTV